MPVVGVHQYHVLRVTSDGMNFSSFVVIGMGRQIELLHLAGDTHRGWHFFRAEPGCLMSMAPLSIKPESVGTVHLEARS